PLKKGYALQLPLYAKAVAQSLPDLELGGFLYHKLDGKDDCDHALHAPKDIRARFRSGTSKGTENPVGFCTDTEEKIIPAIAAAIQSGHFHSSIVPAGASCGYCDYQLIC